MNEPIIEFQDIIAIDDDTYTYEYDPKEDILNIVFSDEEDDYICTIYDKGKWALEESPVQDLEKLKRYLQLCKGV